MTILCVWGTFGKHSLTGACVDEVPKRKMIALPRRKKAGHILIIRIRWSLYTAVNRPATFRRVANALLRSLSTRYCCLNERRLLILTNSRVALLETVPYITIYVDDTARYETCVCVWDVYMYDLVPCSTRVSYRASHQYLFHTVKSS